MRQGTNAVIDVDFSLAVHDRTGKYFIGRDLIRVASVWLGDVYYGAFPLSEPPKGFFGKAIGRYQYMQARGRALGGGFGWLPRRRSRRPLLHLDPFTVLTSVLRRTDVILCHDLGPLSNPDLFEADICRIYSSVYEEIARVGPHLVFVSKASQLAFEEMFADVRLASSRVIYPSIRSEIASGPATPVDRVDAPFLLTVGSVGARKNQLRCIRAFDRSGLAQKGMRYVICGGKEPGYEAVAAAAVDTPGVVLLSYVSDGELRWLYSAACGFVLASLLEGFGIPVAEAISSGLVPAVTYGSVLHEVAGDGALLVDPYDESDIAGAMRMLAGLGPSERSQRLTSMSAAVARFTILRFGEDWNAALAGILSSGSSI